MKPQVDLQITFYLIKQSSTFFKQRQHKPDTQQGNIHNWPPKKDY
jgi:hypothetical protein